jgi:hypothetical protein
MCVYGGVYSLVKMSAHNAGCTLNFQFYVPAIDCLYLSTDHWESATFIPPPPRAIVKTFLRQPDNSDSGYFFSAILVSERLRILMYNGTMYSVQVTVLSLRANIL